MLVLQPLKAGGPPPAPKAGLTEVAAGILATWDDADLVCLGENHGSMADAALRTAVVEHPGFVDTVDVIVMEGASGVHHRLLDRFVVDGEEMSREALRPIWRDAGRGVMWEMPMYEELLRTVRRVNLGVPRARRVRVVGGAVPIPWKEVATAEDLLPWLDRERHLRELFEREVLKPGLKGLTIFGSFHCEKQGASAVAALGAAQRRRVWSAFGFSGEDGAREGRVLLGLGPRPALVPITGTAHAGKPAGAAFFEGHAYSGVLLGDLLDAVIHHGAAPDAVLSVDEETLDPAFRAEVARRDRLRRQAARLVGQRAPEG